MRASVLAYASGWDWGSSLTLRVGIGENDLLRGAMMDDPIAYFLTWPTYGTWLPGDGLGWILYRQGWKLPDPSRVLEAQAKISEAACLLSSEARGVVEHQIAETCRFRGWMLRGVNCRSNHLHAVIGAPNTLPKKVRTDLKAWCSRSLREKIDPRRENWWAERGSIRWVFNDEQLESVLCYVLEAQDRRCLDESARRSLRD